MLTFRLTTPYDLPYIVRYEPLPLLSLGNDLYVHINLSKPVDTSSFETLEASIGQFCGLASSGALGGATIEPWKCNVSVPQLYANSAQHGIWLLPEWKTDERALVLLAQWLLDCQSKCPINEIIFASGITPSSLIKLDQDPALQNPYPPCWPQMPFKYQVDEYFSDVACLYIDWIQKPSNEQREDIEAEVNSWAWATLDGAFPVAPLMPSECGMLYDEDDIEWVDESMEFPFTRFRAHSAAIDALLNICAALHYDVLPIKKILIE